MITHTCLLLCFTVASFKEIVRLLVAEASWSYQALNRVRARARVRHQNWKQADPSTELCFKYLLGITMKLNKHPEPTILLTHILLHALYPPPMYLYQEPTILLTHIQDRSLA